MQESKQRTGHSGGRSARRATRMATDFSMLPGLTRSLPVREVMDEGQVRRIDDASLSILDNTGKISRQRWPIRWSTTPCGTPMRRSACHCNPVMACEIGISGRQMERLFGRYLNCSPKKYCVDLRLQKAQRLLVQTDMSVTEIAFATGFNSPTHFAKIYRVQFGVSPSDQKSKIE